MIKVRDKWFRVLIVVLPFILVLYSNEVCLRADTSKLLRTLISFGCIISITEGARFLTYRSRKWKSPWNKSLIRFLLVIAVGITFTALALAASTVLQDFVTSGKLAKGNYTGFVKINNSQLASGFWGYTIFNALFIFLFLYTGYETIYHFAKLRYTEKEKERLEKEKLRAELNQLKGIVNPHFLFNNLNSLSSLISENPASAEYFLDELTKVFRYLLRNNQSEVTTLGQEMLFIQSYYHLLQTRYGAGIRLEVQVDRQYEAWLLPPLTLQLLIENAVKHNRLQKDQPLHIEIVSLPGNLLMVRNTLSKREGAVESTGQGLHNINARYKMLQLPGVKVEKDDAYFKVTIPLIEPQAEGQQVLGPGATALAQ
ncbi:histidine kinase [Paraflavitalea sp. CAU 1676]|uniref:sensor histidine kinase n=1 Tax=Paraflavitalea sp. CAU 1676 TaxID=3032598 RepID=UPI0023DC5C89|nr:histidine kinase [Paraflavitalea sp. CAU 1676]MDF2191063.1 histidine kinase [Paraflavitalea sp. CAU 1676]